MKYKFGSKLLPPEKQKLYKKNENLLLFSGAMFASLFIVRKKSLVLYAPIFGLFFGSFTVYSWNKYNLKPQIDIKNISN